MNLRVDANSIRLRLSYEEALRLAEGAEVTEKLPLFDSGLTCSVRTCPEPLRFIFDESGRSVSVSLPKEQLEAMLEAVKSGSRKRKDEYELGSSAWIGGRGVEVRFEIDRFTTTGKAI